MLHRRLKRSILKLITSCCSSLCIIAPSAHADDKAPLTLAPLTPGTALIMKRQNGLGHETFIASNDGIKIFFPEAGYGVISAAPDWKVVWFSTSAKTQFTQNVVAFRMEKGFPPSPVVLKAPSVNARYARCKAIEIKRKLTPQESQNFKHGLSDFSGLNDPVAFCDYFFLEPYKLPPQVVDLAAAYYCTPDFGCIPVAMAIYSNGAAARKSFDTIEIKVGPVSKTEFAVPKGLKPASSRAQVVSAGGYKKQMEEIMSDMGVGEDFGAPQSRKSK